MDGQGTRSINEVRADDRGDVKQPTYPDGWDAQRVRRALKYYAAQSAEKAAAEAEAAY
jgi:hypothetical protein